MIPFLYFKGTIGSHMKPKPQVLFLQPMSSKAYTGGQKIHLQLAHDISKSANLIIPEEELLTPPQDSIWNRSFGRYHFTSQLSKYVITIAPDLVFLDLYWFRSYGLVLLKLPKTVKIITYIQTPEALVSGDHTEQNFAPWFYIANPIKLAWYKLLFASILARSVKILTLGPWLKQFLEVNLPGYGLLGLGKKNIITSSGLSITSSATDILTRERRRSSIRFMSVGYVDPYKGVHNLLYALASMPKTLRPHVDWYGQTEHNPPYFKFCLQLSLELEVSDSITFHGWTDPSVMNQHWKNHDVFISVAPLEGYGIVFQEALHNGLFILAPKQSSGRFFINSKSNGILYEEKEPFALAQAIQESKFYVSQLSPFERYQQTANLRKHHANFPSPSNVILDFLNKHDE